MKIKTRHLVLGLALVIAASLLLAFQTDFSFKKKEQINMYIFQEEGTFPDLVKFPSINPFLENNSSLKDFSLS